MLDDAWINKKYQVIFVVLDWSKVFDSISPDGLGDALRRFGIPGKIIRIILNIYNGRRFYVTDFGVDSDFHDQLFGIS